MPTKSVRIDALTYDLLKARAHREGRTLTGMVRWLLVLNTLRHCEHDAPIIKSWKVGKP